MSSIVAAIIGIPMMVGIGFLVWYVWNKNRLLEAKLADGDLGLLNSTSYKVTEVIRAPAGSRVEKVAFQPMNIDMSGYVRQTLPDGRIALVPIAMGQEVKAGHIPSVHSTTHTNQQPPNL
jgi:hypothetical protein